MIWFWGAQLEIGSYPSSLIITPDGGDVTRAADVSTSALGVDSWYIQDEGTFYTEAESVDGNNGVFAISGDPNPPGTLNYDFSSFNVQWQGAVMNGGFNPVDGSHHKFAFTANQGSNVLFADGSLRDTDTTTTTYPAVGLVIGNRSVFGGGPSSTHYLNGHIKRLAYFPTRKTDEQLIELTK